MSSERSLLCHIKFLVRTEHGPLDDVTNADTQHVLNTGEEKRELTSLCLLVISSSLCVDYPDIFVELYPELCDNAVIGVTKVFLTTVARVSLETLESSVNNGLLFHE